MSTTARTSLFASVLAVLTLGAGAARADQLPEPIPADPPVPTAEPAGDPPAEPGAEPVRFGDDLSGDLPGKKHGKHHGKHHGDHDGEHKDDKHKGDKADKDTKELVVSGRVVVREQLASEADAPWTSKLGLDDVRLGATYTPNKRLAIDVELGATADSVSLKNAAIELRLAKGWELRAGRFRNPFSGVNGTSRWKLPTIDRGLQQDLLDDGMGVMGRRNGAQVTWKPDCACKPEVTLGAFQGLTGGGSNKGLLSDDQGALDVILRGEISPVGKALRLGASGSSRVALKNAAEGRSRYWAGGLDAVVTTAAGPGTLRAWVDGTVGTTHLDATPMTTKTPVFVAGRAIVAWRHGGAESGDRYVEPFASATVTDVNLDNADDLVTEYAGGVNLGLWTQWRLQLQADVRDVGELVPAAIAGGISAPASRVAVTAQLGAAF